MPAPGTTILLLAPLVAQLHRPRRQIYNPRLIAAEGAIVLCTPIQEHENAALFFICVHREHPGLTARLQGERCKRRIDLANPLEGGMLVYKEGNQSLLNTPRNAGTLPQIPILLYSRS